MVWPGPASSSLVVGSQDAPIPGTEPSFSFYLCCCFSCTCVCTCIPPSVIFLCEAGSPGHGFLDALWVSHLTGMHRYIRLYVVLRMRSQANSCFAHWAISPSSPACCPHSALWGSCRLLWLVMKPGSELWAVLAKIKMWHGPGDVLQGRWSTSSVFMKH